MIPTLRKTLLPAAILAFAWALTAAITGGIDTRIAGVVIRARGANRPLVIAFLLLTAYAAVNRDAFARLAARVSGVLLPAALPVAVAAALAVGVAAVRYGSFTAGGSDSWGYVSQAYGWARGELPSAIPLPYVMPFQNADMVQIPLGYHQGVEPHTMVPTYAPGLPLLMAAAIRAAGACGPFLVNPICATALVWFTFLLANRIGGRVVGGIAAVVIATTPVALLQAMAPMSDVPAGAFWTGALWGALSGSRRHALVAGVCTAVGLLIRPNIVPLALVPIAAAALVARSPRDRWVNAVLVAAPVAAAAVFIASLNTKWYGSPGGTGYGSPRDLYSAANIWPNLRLYVQWFFQSESLWALVGILALVPPARRLAAARPIAVLVATILVTLACYLAYGQYEVWWYLRFLMPAAGAMATLIAIGVVALTDVLPTPWGRLAAAATLVGLVTATMTFASRQPTFGSFRDGERRYIEIGEFVSQSLPQNAAILALQHSGSLRFYGGRMTLRFDWIEHGAERHAAADLERIGLHPYLVLDDFEQPLFRSQFGVPPGDRLPFPVVARMRELGGTTIFDLASHPLASPPVALEPGHARRCSGPEAPLRIRDR